MTGGQTCGFVKTEEIKKTNACIRTDYREGVFEQKQKKSKEFTSIHAHYGVGGCFCSNRRTKKGKCVCPRALWSGRFFRSRRSRKSSHVSALITAEGVFSV
eukprot:GEMP01109500.1.p1 GENE.GEMP01109500.1~~GEMP01109500.1.p1  ORF type:complete len:101 (-),score=11.08 GEMP01109500.1:105-407(-)